MPAIVNDSFCTPEEVLEYVYGNTVLPSEKDELEHHERCKQATTAYVKAVNAAFTHRIQDWHDAGTSLESHGGWPPIFSLYDELGFAFRRINQLAHRSALEQKVALQAPLVQFQRRTKRNFKHVARFLARQVHKMARRLLRLGTDDKATPELYARRRQRLLKMIASRAEGWIPWFFEFERVVPKARDALERFRIWELQHKLQLEDTVEGEQTFPDGPVDVCGAWGQNFDDKDGTG